MLTLDFAAAKLRHTSWKSKLRRFLDGDEALTLAQATDQHACDVGRWLYAPGSGGLAKWGGHAEIRSTLAELERVHAAMHTAVKQVIESKLAGRTLDAERAFDEADQLSATVVAILTRLEPLLGRAAA